MKSRESIIGFGIIGFFALVIILGSLISSTGSVSTHIDSDTSNAAVTPSTEDAENAKEIEVPKKEVVMHVPLPDEVKAIYMTSCVVGTQTFRDRLVQLIEETELNAIVIDIKDYSGTISFNPGIESAWYPAWQEARCGTSDMREFLSVLHEKDIFVIGRITVFQDPFYTPKHPEHAVTRSDRVTIWEDNKGISFVDVGARGYWDHILDLVTLSYNIGFDEINFDYVRYPSDGNMSDIAFPSSEVTKYGVDKSANLEAFFEYLQDEVASSTRYAAYEHTNTGRSTSTPWTSADLFGMTTTAQDGMNIGQVLERALPYFDFIAPMVYPSHYPKGYIGMANPNTDPYRIVYHAMHAAVERAQSTTTTQVAFPHTRIGTSTPALYEKAAYDGTRLRTWIQDFDYGGNYGPAEVRAQIKASVDAGVSSWMIWAPSNIYTRGALLDAEQAIETAQSDSENQSSFE